MDERRGQQREIFSQSRKWSKSKNLISSLTIDGSVTDDPHLIELALINFYKSLYNKDSKRDAWFEIWHGKSITTLQASFLEKEFTLDEIKKAIFYLPKEKAPGLDGYPLLFFQECWDIIKDDLFSFFSEFHANGKIPRGLNATFLTLISKKSGASEITDFRPISLYLCPL